MLSPSQQLMVNTSGWFHDSLLSRLLSKMQVTLFVRSRRKPFFFVYRYFCVSCFVSLNLRDGVVDVVPSFVIANFFGSSMRHHYLAVVRETFLFLNRGKVRAQRTSPFPTTSVT